MFLSITTKSRTNFLRRQLPDLLQNLLKFCVSTLEMGDFGIFIKLQILGVVQINYIN